MHFTARGSNPQTIKLAFIWENRHNVEQTCKQGLFIDLLRGNDALCSHFEDVALQFISFYGCIQM
jgi:hypothetical protein